jgi:hypothetical protein
MCGDALTEGAGRDACQKEGYRLSAKLNGGDSHRGDFSAHKSPATALARHCRDMWHRRLIRFVDLAEAVVHPYLRNQGG